MIKRIQTGLFIIFTGLLTEGVAAPADSIAEIRAVGAEGKGNAKAAGAWSDLIEADADAIVGILEAMDGANGIAANWLRSAVEAIADREKELPLGDLKVFLADTSHDDAARVLAFELIQGADAAAAEALVPGMVNDPSVTLRRGAVGRLIEEANALKEAKKKGEAIESYRAALDAGRDLDQIKAIAKSLRELEQKVDLPLHFGFLMRWSVVAPFDNTERGGFAKVFGPEKGVDLGAKYEGKDGEVIWQKLETADEYGMVDFNKPFGLLKEVTGYAFTEFESEEERDVELRLGCKNGWKVWVNGELLFERDEYHRGIRIDQYRMPVTLKKGKNTILVKACQDNQTQDWTVEWQFQLRVCDGTGTAVLAENRGPTPVDKGKVDKRRG